MAKGIGSDVCMNSSNNKRLLVSSFLYLFLCREVFFAMVLLLVLLGRSVLTESRKDMQFMAICLVLLGVGTRQILSKKLQENRSMLETNTLVFLWKLLWRILIVCELVLLFVLSK